MNNKVFNIFNINKKKNDECVVPVVVKETSIVEAEEPVIVQKIQPNSPNDLGDIHTGPYRPILQVYPKTKQGTQNRSFSASWYDHFPWIEYSIESNAIYCYVCRIFGNETSEDTFVKIGFNNWKKLSGSKGKGSKSKLQLHGSSNHHLVCSAKWFALKQTKKSGSVHTNLETANREQISINREYLKILIDIVLYLSRQGLAFRGHDEKELSTNQGNFLETCKLIAKHNTDFFKKYETPINYTSWAIQNQIVQLCADNVISTISTDIKKCGFFSIMCDEARSFKEEQMALCVRYTNHFQIFERFLGFINVSENQNSESLTSAIVCFLGKYNLIDVPIIAQSYDGASVMSGKHGGVQKKIQEKYPYTIYTHCMAHRTNLVVIDMCKSVNEAKSLFNTLEAVYVHFAMPTTNYKFLEIKNKLKIKNKSITRISDTRWSCRYHNCKVIMENYPALIEVLNEEIEDNNDRDVAQAKGILSLLQEPGFVVHLFVLYEILLVVNILSNRLQEKTATLGQAAQIIHSVIQSLKDYRNDDKFLVIWNQINEFAKKHQVSIEKPTIGLGSKRRRVESTRLSNFYVTSTTSAQQEVSAQVTNEAFWRIKYYAVLDSVIENLIRRFSDQSLELAQSVDNFFLLDFKESKLFINHYKDLFQIDTDTLMAEMTVAKNAFQTVYQDQVLGDPEQMKSIINEATFPNLYKLLGVAYTLPISSATCERSFSAMRRVKTWLRSTMIQERFSNLSIIHIERDISNNINSEDILNDFSSANNRKIPLIY